MELLFLWMEEELVLRELPLNFSSQYKFTCLFNEEAKTVDLSIVENELYIPNLFGKVITNITAIVGSNGTGKSTLLEFLCNILSNQSYLGDMWIGVFYDPRRKALHTYHTLRDLDENIRSRKTWRINLTHSLTNVKVEEPQEIAVRYNLRGHPNDWSLPLLKNSKVIFYSPVFDLKNYPEKVKNSKNFEDVSTNHLLFTDSENDYEKTYDQIEHHRFKNTLRQFQLAESKLANLDALNIPEDIQILFRKTGRIEESDLGIETNAVYKYLRKRGSQDLQRCNGLIEEAKKISDSAADSAIKEKIKIWFLINLLDNFFDNLAGYKDLDDKKFFVPESKVTLEDFTEAVRTLFRSQEWISPKRFDFNAFIDFIFVTIDRDALNVELPENDCYFYIPVSKAIGIYQWHFKYVQLFRKTNGRKGFLELNWRDLSTGEKAYLDFYSRLFYGYRRVTDNFQVQPEFDHEDDEENIEELNFIYILLDEAELGFHPLWQRKFVQSLITFITNMSKDTRVQVIMTSHSPFVLSDLPKSNVIFLQRKDHATELANLASRSQTFAANIHELFSDSFFMEEGLLGEFATSFIKELLQEISQLKNKVTADKLKDLTKRIELIGEPIIKARLIEVITDLQLQETREEEITRLEKELAAARKRTN